MFFIPNVYLEVLKRRNFFLLSLMVFLGQLASAFLIISLIVSVFAQTKSTFSVSGILLSFTVPAFLLMAFAGLAADMFDRKKVMLIAYILISIVVLMILVLKQMVAASIPLSFLYFAGNTFFIPASSAASAQLVKKSQLLIANSIFIFILSAASLSGFFLASVIHLFFGNFVAILVSEFLLVLAVIFGFFLPKLEPVRRNHPSVFKNIREIIGGFLYIMKDKIVWYFFLIFALMQGIIFFGITLAPGFFSEIVNIPIDKSPILVFPLIGLGVLAGVGFVHRPKISEGFMVALGLSLIGLATSIMGFIIKFNLIVGSLLFYVSPFLLILGFGAIITMIAARTVLQKEVPHSHLGTVFGANMILASLLSAVMSLFAAVLEVLLGYVNVLIYSGLIFLLIAAVYAHLGNRWKF